VPIPREHVERLEAEQLSGHESWLRTLRRQVEGLEAEASVHEMMLRLGRDAELRRVLDELHDQPDLAERIANEPHSFFESRGIEVPDGATVKVTSDSGQSAVEALFVNPFVHYGVGWSHPDGFHLIQAAEPSEPTDAAVVESALEGVRVDYSITVDVYEKNGPFKRGKGLTDAYFLPELGYQAGHPEEINWTGGGPLAGARYQLKIHQWEPYDPIEYHYTPMFFLRIGATKHYPQSLFVQDGDSFEVRLDPM
jgi:hypothetical protein